MYGRYRRLLEFRRSLDDRALRILDVGDPFGTISSLFPGDATISVDPLAAGAPTAGHHQHIIGSGYELPFPDASFDLVASHDTFEHLQAERRMDFVAELLRVAKGPMLLVAPFFDARAVRCESLINAYFAARVGNTIDALDEHAQFGLPRLDELTAWLDEHSIEHEAYGDGWLYSWVAFWMLKGHLSAESRTEDMYRLHAAVNQLLGETDIRPPHYRRCVLIRPQGKELTLPAVDADSEVETDVEALTELSLQMGRVLVAGDDPFDPDSRSARWMQDLGHEEGPLGDVARLMTRVLEAVKNAEGGAGVDPDEQQLPSERSLPTVAVIVVNLDGAAYLRDCLDSLAAQDYPSERLEVVVVDNGSKDGSVELLSEAYPWARVLAQDSNLGFAPAVDLGVRSVDTDCVALLNNDMRVAEDWVTELVRLYAPDEGVPCVGGHILSWDGETVDFARAAMNFTGMGLQLGFGRARSSVTVVDGEEILFACGGAMLVQRETYLNSGGFDSAFFAYYEDVDFGWRMWTLGARVRLASKAVSYHRHHGTSSRFPEHQRQLLMERNALRSMIKNYDEENLQATLGPALLLLIERAISRGSLDRAPYDIGADGEETEVVGRAVLAHLHAVGDVVADLPLLLAQRELIQGARLRTDAEIMERFGRPFVPPIADPAYLDAQHKVVSAFGLDKRFERYAATRLLVVVGPASGGAMCPGSRPWEMARSLSDIAQVTMATRSAPGAAGDGFAVELYRDEDKLRSLATGADVVILHGEGLADHGWVAGTGAIIVADLHDPRLFDHLAQEQATPNGSKQGRLSAAVLQQLLKGCDLFLAASETQRDYWIGLLSAVGRLDDAANRHDPTLRELIDVVPSGILDRPPWHRRAALRGLRSGIGAEDPLALFEGDGLMWRDPITVIEAWPAVLEQVPNAKLQLLGLHSPGPEENARRRADELGLTDTSMFFGPGVGGEEREPFLLEADVAVVVGTDDYRTHLAPETQLLGYLWAGLPVVVTQQEPGADLVQAERLGHVTAPGDVGAMASALVSLLADPLLRSDCSARSRTVAERFRWHHAVQPLRAVLAKPWKWRASRRLGDGVPSTEEIRMLVDLRTAELRQHVSQLEATVQHQDERLAMLRKSPVYPVFVAAKRTRQWAKRFSS
jgi:GT2 family glycosyltransferase